MEICNLYPGGFASNCYLLCEGRDAVLIDCSAPAAAVFAALEQRRAQLRAILCTHGHFDHLLTADGIRDDFAVPLYVHEADADMPADGCKNASFACLGIERTWRPAEELFADGEQLSFGAVSLRVLHTPGHSRGSSVFLGENIAFTGDTLFAQGYGRTDLFGGDSAALRTSLQKLSTLSPALTICAGHGETASLQSALNTIF